MNYPTYRNSPIFPATSYGVSQSDDTSFSEAKLRYYNNDINSSLLGCVDHTQINMRVPSRKMLAPSPIRQPKGIAAIRHQGHVVTAQTLDLTLLLLESCLADSSICSALIGDTMLRGISALPLEAESHCFYFARHDLPDDQWKIEVSRWFEAPLARIQLNLLGIVHGGNGTENHTNGEDYEGIPPAYRAICKLGKFKTTGWRNLNAWRFLGLLSLAAGVTTASCETESGNLWVVVGADAVGWSLRSCFGYMASLLWSRVSEVGPVNSKLISEVLSGSVLGPKLRRLTHRLLNKFRSESTRRNLIVTQPLTRLRYLDNDNLARTRGAKKAGLQNSISTQLHQY